MKVQVTESVFVHTSIANQLRSIQTELEATLYDVLADGAPHDAMESLVNAIDGFLDLEELTIVENEDIY